MRVPWLPAIIVTGVLMMAAPAVAVTPSAVLRFATSCATCHEGECSGRLSFARHPSMTYQHIRQYAGPVDDALASQLYATLERMKSSCDYPSLASPQLDEGLGADQLAVYRDPWSGAYFIPTGLLEPGLYRIELRFGNGGRARIELIDHEFEPLIDECATLGPTELRFEVRLAERRRGYLRLRPRGGQVLRRLRLRQTR